MCECVAQGELSGSLESQLDALAAVRAEVAEKAGELAQVEELSEQLVALDAVGNPYTPETIFSLRAVWGALQQVFDTAEASVQGQVRACVCEPSTC